MPSYDAERHEPPAPIARVVLRHPDDPALTSQIDLLMDTGADVTLLPQTAVEKLRIPLLSDIRYEIAGFDGAKRMASVAVADVILLNRVYRGRYLLVDAAEGVLGRDVLNHLVLLYDGPAHQWSESVHSK